MNSPGPIHGLNEENLLTAFPVALQGDQATAALAKITARILARRPEEIDHMRIYPAIHRLDEKLLDILAYDFKVDWWDANYTTEEKRRTLAGSWYVHKHLGTKAAVEAAIRAVYPHTTVEEWFEYGGKPYHFRLHIDLTGEAGDAARPYRVLERVNFYKSLRSHMEEIVFTIIAPAAALHIGGGVGAGVRVGVPREPDSYDFRDTLHTGGSFGMEASAGTEAESDSFQFQAALRTGGTAAARAVLPVPEDAAQPAAATILRTGGVCTIISNLSRGE